MGRLIDADVVEDILKNCVNNAFKRNDHQGAVGLNLAILELRNVPTAYDVDKVVAELEEAKEKVAKEDYCRTKHYIENDCEHKDCFRCCAEYLIDIVKAGRVE